MIEIEKRLDKLAEEINEEHRSFRQAFKATYRSALRAGDLLNEAKAKAGHGNWAAWVEENCEFSDRTARVYMRLANNRDKVEEMLKSAGPADLSIESVLQELATPKPSHVADAPLAGEDREREEKPKDMGLTRTPVTGGLTWAHAATKRPGVIEQAQESPEGREALAEINREFNDEGVYLKVRSKIHDLFWMVRHMPPEEAAKREFAHHAADIARDVVIGRRHYRPIHQIEEAEGVREWLGNYVQSLKDAEARLHERS